MQTELKDPNSSLLLLENLVECNISRESACENNSILDCLGDLLLVIDKNRIITKVNKSTCDTFKKKPEELIGRHCYEIVHGTKAPWCNCPATKTFETKQVATEEINDPNLGIPLLVTTSAILDERGEVSQVIHLAKDITEKEKAEERNLLLASIVDHSDDAIISKNLDGIITSWNIAAEKIYGYSAAEIIGKSIEILAPYEEKYEIDLILKRICAGEQIEKYETKRRRKDGVEIDVSLTVSPIKNKGGAIVGASTIARDITENKKAEEKIKESQEKYQTTFNSSMDALMLLDEKSFFDCNKATLELFGCSSVKEFTCFHPADLSPPTQPDGTQSMNAAMGHIEKALRTGTDHFFWIHKRIDDTTFPADVLLTRMPLKGREVLQATVRDITEQRKAEEKIKFHADLLNHVGQAVLMVDNNRIIRFWNKAAEKLYGYSEEQALGHNVTELLGGTSPEEAKEVGERLMAGESWSTEVLAKNKDGSVVPVILNRTPIYNANGEFLGSASITTDISTQKNTEADLTFSLTSLSNTLDKIQELNEKLRVVGSLTRHDVRNKLSDVTGYAYLLKKRHKDLADVVDGLSRMEHAVAESMKIFDFAKMYERLGVEELKYVDVEKTLSEAVELFSGLTVMVANGCHGLTVLADSLLRQLFYNLVDNTRKYGQKTTTIRVRYEKTDQDSLKLVYEDDGVGIPYENKPKLFHEGFSTGGSTGYGLFLTNKMMDVYGWRIEEKGEPRKGAKFIITIPKLNENGKENYQITS